LEKLDRTELEGVVAHELSHVKNYDIRLMSIVSILVGSITLLADMFLRMSMFGNNRKNNQAGPIMLILGLVLVLLSPIIATIIKLAISRRREFLADASAVEMTRFPDGLKRALLKISQSKVPLKNANKATAHLYITNPLNNHHDSVGWFANLFSTHPPINERIAALENMR
jgi:heat shock protein HtpX